MSEEIPDWAEEWLKAMEITDGTVHKMIVPMVKLDHPLYGVDSCIVYSREDFETALNRGYFPADMLKAIHTELLPRPSWPGGDDGRRTD